MIINVSKKGWESFSVMQRLAVRGEQMVHQQVKTFEAFEKLYDSHKNVSKILVDTDIDFVLINDIINCVTCRIVTLGIESIVDTGRVNFLNYEGS